MFGHNEIFSWGSLEPVPRGFALFDERYWGYTVINLPQPVRRFQSVAIQQRGVAVERSEAARQHV